MLATVDSAKALRKTISRNLATRERLRTQRQAALQEKLRQGLAGQKVGKHKVPEGQVDVQLGEELSESLRGLKVRFRFRRSFRSLRAVQDLTCVGAVGSRRAISSGIGS